jgi:ParB family chromosome partitioning protein
MIRKIPIAQITVGPRHRKDMGDLHALSDSINQLGLLQPIGVTPSLHLVWGQRRLKACQMLNWQEIDAVVDPSLDDILRAMQAEEDENNCRLPFSPSERVSIADHIEAVERQRAEERQKASQAKPHNQLRRSASQERNGGAESAPPIGAAKNGDFAASTDSSPAAPERDEPVSGKARDKVAAAVGLSHDTLTKARKVVAEGTPELVEAMDNGMASINAAAAIASLPPEEQREVVAGGKEAIVQTAAAIRTERSRKAARPALLQAVERLEELAALPHMKLSMAALREAVADLRKELGALLS